MQLRASRPIAPEHPLSPVELTKRRKRRSVMTQSAETYHEPNHAKTIRSCSGQVLSTEVAPYERFESFQELCLRRARRSNWGSP